MINRTLPVVVSRALSRLASVLALFVVTATLGACNDGAAGESATSLDVSIVDDSGTSDAAADAGGGIDVRVVNCEGEDDLSPNHAAADAFLIESGGLSREDLYICAGFDDWFAIDAGVGQRIRVSVDIGRDTGDLDVFLFLEGGEIDLDAALATSATAESPEAFSYEAQQDGRYLIYVQSFDRAEGLYDIDVARSCRDASDCGEGAVCSYLEQACVPDVPADCGDDVSEPNNGPGQATEIAFGSDGFGFAAGGAVCDGDDDYFALTLEEAGTLRAELQWNDPANLDLFLFDSTGRLVGQSAAEGGSTEFINGAFLPAGDYFAVVTVTASPAGGNSFYDLTFSRDAGVCTTDADCGSVGGRQLCEDGACVSYEPETLGEAGADCDDSGDCVEGLGCYTGVGGFGDNYCTQTCQSDFDCEFFGVSGQCLFTGTIAVCAGACESDADCPTYYSCDGGRCDVRECRVDADCGDGQFCRRTEQQNNGYCTSTPFPGCLGDDDLEPNDTDSQAVAIDDFVEAVVCDENDDWYAYVVEDEGTRLFADISFSEGSDLDVYLFDDQGRRVGQAASEDNPETLSVRYLAAGTYLLRVNQFPLERDALSNYEVEIETSPDACESDDDCLPLQPLRIDCDEEVGACRFFEGNGEVPLGGFCDSTDDCVSDAQFCWNFEPATEGRNICTRQCGSQADCDDVPGTTCVQFGRGFAACIIQ